MFVRARQASGENEPLELLKENKFLTNHIASLQIHANRNGAVLGLVHTAFLAASLVVEITQDRSPARIENCKKT